MSTNTVITEHPTTKQYEEEDKMTNSAPTYLHVTSTDNKAKPHLAYLKISLGALDNDNSEKVVVKALHDSGCAATIINKKIFDTIPNHEIIEVTPTPNTFVVSVTGEQTAVYGQATIYLTFEGQNGIDMRFPLDVHIHSNVDHDFILGRDFTGSDSKLFETREHLYLTNEYDITDVEDFWTRAKNTACCVPIMSTYCKTYMVQSAHTLLIPAFTTASIPCKLADQQLDQLPLTTGDSTIFEVINVSQPRLKSFKNTLFTYENSNDFEIPIYNDTNQEYLLEADRPIADIHIWEENPLVFPIETAAMAELLILESNHAKLKQTLNIDQAKAINNDEILTEEEKLENFYKYLQEGSYAEPMSTYVDRQPSITEMELKDVRPLSDEEVQAQFKINHLKSFERKYAKNMLLKYMKVFSRHEYDIGKSTDIEMDIQIDETKPRIQKFIPLPHPVREPARQILDQMLEFDMIRECNEPSLFCSNLLVTKKKDKSKIRMLLDGRLLNSATIRLPLNLVTQMEIFAHLSGKQHITTMDVSQAFFQIPLAERAQPLTAFYSEAHGKRYCFKRCPQGLKNSPLHLKLLMDKLLGHLSQNVIHYADDILVATDGTMQEHLDMIGKVLQALQDGNIKIRPDKIHIATGTIEFLGIIWNKGNLNIPEAKIKSFMEYPRPNTPKQCKQFVMAMSYYRQFLPRFAEVSFPIMELAPLHHKQFKWTNIQELAFRKLKNMLLQYTSVNIPDPFKPFYVQTDASQYCGAGRVFQKDKEGNELLLACLSRTFTRTERNYGIFRKETLALLYTLKAMDFFLRFAAKIIIMVDAKSILFLRMCKESAGILLRFSIEISKYEAEIYHIPGEQNIISDILSRQNESLDEIIKQHKNRHILTEKQTEEILQRLCIPEGRIFTPEEVKWLLEADSLENPLIATSKKKPQSHAKPGIRPFKNDPKTLGPRKVKMPAESMYRRQGVLLPAYSTQPQTVQPQHISYSDFQIATKLLTNGDVSIKNLIQAQKSDQQISRILQLPKLPPNFVMIEKLLYHKRNGKCRLAIPAAFLDPLINAKHFTVFGLHFSKARIKRDITGKFFVNIAQLNYKLNFLKENCVICQFNNTSPTQHPLTQSNLILSPRTTWACDIIPSLPKSNNDYTAIFLAVDMFTGYIQLQPIKSRQTSELIEAVIRSILIPFSTPKYFRCDSETGMFSSTEFFNFMNPLGIKFLPCSTGAPWSNGAAERAVQTIKLGLKKFIQQEHTHNKWDEYLHFFCGSHNKSTSVYGHAPEELMFGFLNPNPSDLFQLWPNVHDPNEYLKQIVGPAEQARKETQIEQNKRINQNITYRNQKLVKKTFRVGEIILQKQLQCASGPGKAFQPKYNGPYVIISIDDDLSSAVIEHMETNQQTRAHFSNITKLNYHPQHHRFPEKYDSQLLAFLPEKYSKDIYYPSDKRKRNRQTSFEKDSKNLPTFIAPSHFPEFVIDEFVDIQTDQKESEKENISQKEIKSDINDDIENIDEAVIDSMYPDDLLDEFSPNDDSNIEANITPDPIKPNINTPLVISSQEIDILSQQQEKDEEILKERTKENTKKNRRIFVPQIFSKEIVDRRNDKSAEEKDTENTFEPTKELRVSSRLKKPPDRYQANLSTVQLLR